MHLVYKAMISLGILTMAASAFALEDHAVLQGSFNRIYENGEGNHIDDAAKRHLIPSIRADRQPSGLFRLVVTMPPTLAGGQTVTSTYDQVAGDEDFPLKFTNFARPDDYFHCNGYDEADSSWDGLGCRRMTLKGLNAVPLAQRQNYAKQRYGGTAIGDDVILVTTGVSGAQPAGSVEFFSAANGDYAPWVGVWSIKYSAPGGQIVQGKMYFDGFSGSYVTTSGAKGVLTHVSVGQDGSATGNWQMGSSTGFFTFYRNGTSFTGDWNADDSDASGSWSGSRLP